LNADASRPAADAKPRNIQMCLRFHALLAGHLNAQNCEPVFYEPQRHEIKFEIQSPLNWASIMVILRI
jgi:hypothetical protein